MLQSAKDTGHYLRRAAGGMATAEVVKVVKSGTGLVKSGTGLVAWHRSRFEDDGARRAPAPAPGGGVGKVYCPSGILGSSP